MRISTNNNYLNFGYNKYLNNKINSKLERYKGGDEDLTQNMLEMNKLVMKTEDNLRNAERHHDLAKIEDYSYMLLNMKPAIVNCIDSRYPASNYLNKEVESYKKELSKPNAKKRHWLKKLVSDLDGDNVNAQGLLKEASDLEETLKTVKISKPKSAEKAEKIQPKSEEKVKSKSGADFVEKYVPNKFSPTGFDNLGGMEEIKENLYDRVIFPIEHPNLAKLDEVEYGVFLPRGELFYGPPGCGKTSIIEATANEANVPMYKLKVAKSGSKYINESASNLQQGYEYVAGVAEETGQPVILMIDEMDSLASNRTDKSNKEDNKVVDTLLQIIEEARGKNVIILAATNNFDQVDEAVRSRMDGKNYVGLPDDDTRGKVLNIHLRNRIKGVALADNKEDMEKAINMTKGFSNRDIAILVDGSARRARKDNRRDITIEDLETLVKENENMKVDEYKYKDKKSRPSIGFKN